MTDEEFRDRLIAALERIAVAEDALAKAVEVIEPPQPEPEPICPPHPVEGRIEFGVTDGAEDWQCGRCGYRSTAGAHDD